MVYPKGPIPSTIGDFWRLVWEENSRTIVMVTNVKEKSQVRYISKMITWVSHDCSFSFFIEGEM